MNLVTKLQSLCSKKYQQFKHSFSVFRNVKSTCKLYDQEKFKTEPSIIVGFHNGRLGNQVHMRCSPHGFTES